MAWQAGKGRARSWTEKLKFWILFGFLSTLMSFIARITVFHKVSLPVFPSSHCKIAYFSQFNCLGVTSCNYGGTAAFTPLFFRFSRENKLCYPYFDVVYSRKYSKMKKNGQNLPQNGP